MTKRPEQARAFWVAEPGRGEIRAEPLRAPAANEALVRTLYTGISRGTEALVFKGKVPRSEHERMRAPFQAGEFPAPVKYGYCNVGVVEQGPAELAGRHVFCLYPHQTRYVVPVGALHVLPDDVPPARAVLAANLETAVNALWDAAPRVGDRVAVVGAGTVGCLVGLARGTHRRRRGRARRRRRAQERRGARARRAVSLAGRRAPRRRRRRPHERQRGRARDGARARRVRSDRRRKLSWYGDDAPAVPLGGAFHSRRLTLKSSQVGAVADAQRARWSHARRMELVMRLLANAELDALVTGESPFDELPAVLARLAASPGYTLTHRIVY